jgi:hypothetical protein
MSVIKQYNNITSQWETIVVGKQGPQGATGPIGATGPGGPINATNDTTTTTLYPVMVGAAGSNQTPKVTTAKLTFNASTGQLSATDLNSTSDERLKEDIKQISNALEKVLKLRGVSYTLKESGVHRIGVIAQEVEEIIPEVIGMIDDDIHTKTVSYGNLIGLLIEAIKELSEEIENLKNK